MDLSGKAALVTGGSRGIGREICLKLAERGADVGVNFLGNGDAAEESRRKIEEMGRKAVTIRADVSDSGDVAKMIDNFVKSFGRIDILINNAGINRDALMIRMKEEDWDAVVATNLKGTFFCTQTAAKVMIKNRSGTIVNISSVVGLTGNYGQINYSSAKAGIIGLTKTAARELAARNIRVNVVAPGFIETEMTMELSEENRNRILKSIPLGEFGKVGDVANLVCFLASDEAGYITGQTFVVDGGLTI